MTRGFHMAKVPLGLYFQIHAWRAYRTRPARSGSDPG